MEYDKAEMVHYAVRGTLQPGNVSRHQGPINQDPITASIICIRSLQIAQIAIRSRENIQVHAST